MVSEANTTQGGISRRSTSSSAPSAPKTARRIALSVIRIIGSMVSNCRPSGQEAHSRSVSSSMICSY
ncbi:Uncharacterised protein [Mycobacteroides abscessus subsp. abscessus]|nr:Uncharacterised protein [Mycobacteroides abscessus subsp. abscessus]